MRRLGRYALNALTVLSLLLCVATIVLWVRSYWVISYLRFDAHWDSGHWLHLEDGTAVSCTGELHYAWSRQLLGPNPEMRVIAFTRSVTRFETPMTPRWQANRGGTMPATYIGFGYAIHESTRLLSAPDPATLTGTWQTVAVPYWGVTVSLALLPGVRGLIGWRRRRSALIGNQCRVCAYDLRATPGRCPECGAVPQNVA
jgi:hypothetical protein